MNTATPQERTAGGLHWRQLCARGQGLVEYAMIMVMIAIVIIVILTYLGQTVFVNLYSKIDSGMGTAGG